MSEIILTDPIGLREAIAFAEANGCLDQLGFGLIRLLQTLTVGMTKDDERTAELGSDFAPYSQRFCVWDGARQQSNVVLAGGWIYDGPSAPGDGSFPSLSVNLARLMGNAPTHSWNVHT
jgi:hypothetical protein